jgi:hypothetical protein
LAITLRLCGRLKVLVRPLSSSCEHLSCREPRMLPPKFPDHRDRWWASRGLAGECEKAGKKCFWCRWDNPGKGAGNWTGGPVRRSVQDPTQLDRPRAASHRASEYTVIAVQIPLLARRAQDPVAFTGHFARWVEPNNVLWDVFIYCVPQLCRMPGQRAAAPGGD